MSLTYLDTSAAMKLLVQEAESAALLSFLAGSPDRVLVAAWLLHTELHSAAGRRPEDVSSTDVAAVLQTVELIDVDRGDFVSAGTHASLRSNDALHLAVAIRLGVDELLTYDAELAQASSQAGLAVVAPA